LLNGDISTNIVPTTLADWYQQNLLFGVLPQHLPLTRLLNLFFSRIRLKKKSKVFRDFTFLPGFFWLYENIVRATFTDWYQQNLLFGVLPQHLLLTRLLKLFFLDKLKKRIRDFTCFFKNFLGYTKILSLLLLLIGISKIYFLGCYLSTFF